MLEEIYQETRENMGKSIDALKKEFEDCRLTVENMSKKNNANVYQADYVGKDNQKWLLVNVK